jgi:hypothetical protein
MNQKTIDGQIACITPRIDVEDAGSLILFIDHFLPMLDKNDPDSMDTAANVFRVRQKLHQSIPERFRDEIPQGVNPHE